MADVNMQNTSLLINQNWTGFGNMSGAGGDFAPPVSVQATFSVLYTLIICLAVGGNGIVCYIITSSRHMRTITNFFLLNLAISDIIIAVLCIPFSFISNIVLAHWPFGMAMCPIMTYAQTVSVFLSSLTLVAISLDRLIAVTRPLRQRMTMKQLVVTVMLIWIVALGISLPVAIVSRLEPFEGDPSLYWCKEAWPDEQQRLRYSIAILVLQYFLPLSVLVFTYTWIGIIVWGKRPPGEAEAKRDQRIASSKRRMVKMMITVVVIYALCWLPIHLITILGDATDNAIYNLPGMPTIWVFCLWLSMSNSCYNPIIYCWMNTKFRNGFRKALRCLPCVKYDALKMSMAFTFNSQQPTYSDGRRNSLTAETAETSNGRSPHQSTIHSHSMRTYKPKDTIVTASRRQYTVLGRPADTGKSDVVTNVSTENLDEYYD